MIVCHCHGHSERALRRAERSGAETRREVSRACGAGASCGGCRPAIREIIRTEQAPRNRLPMDGPLPVAAGR